MSKIYVGQDVTLTLESNIALGAASPLQIRYIDPSGTTGNLTATASGTAAIAELEDTLLTTAGGWRFYIYAEISGKKLFGEVFKKDVTTPGQ